MIFQMKPKIRKSKFKPIIKFNGGRGAILCNKCRVIIKEDLALEEFLGKTDLVLCHKCAMKIVNKEYKKIIDNEK